MLTDEKKELIAMAVMDWYIKTLAHGQAFIPTSDDYPTREELEGLNPQLEEVWNDLDGYGTGEDFDQVFAGIHRTIFRALSALEKGES